MQAHIYVDSQNKLTNSMAVTAVNIYDSHVLCNLLHGTKCQLVTNAPEAKYFTYDHNRRNNLRTEKEYQINRNKSKTRSRLEHLFSIIKHQLINRKVCHNGLIKKHEYFS